MGVLLMLLTIGGVTVATIVLVIAIYTGKIWLRNFVFGGVVVWFVFYSAMLMGFSLSSKDADLALNEPKKFCGFYLDCHMHTAVTDIRKTKTIGNKTANGEFYIVAVEVFSDAVKATLGLHTVDAHVVDTGKREYTRDLDAEAQLEPQPEFEKQIGPEESFKKQIVFDLPADATDPRLDIREGIAIERVIETFLVGDEDSILHKRAYFKLDAGHADSRVRN